MTPWCFGNARTLPNENTCLWAWGSSRSHFEPVARAAIFDPSAKKIGPVRRKTVDQLPCFQRLDAMRQIGRHDEVGAGLDHVDQYARIKRLD